MENKNNGPGGDKSTPLEQIQQASPASHDGCRYGWRAVDNTMEAIKFTFNSVSSGENNSPAQRYERETVDGGVAKAAKANNEPDGCARDGNFKQRISEVHQDLLGGIVSPSPVLPEMPQEPFAGLGKKDTVDSCTASVASMHNNVTESTSSMRSIGSFVCRICHNSEHPERLVSPCLCKGSLTYVHIYCLEHWISTSGKTTCELCQFRYHTIQTLRYTCLQSLRMWYSHSMSRRALQEDCQMFSLLTLVNFGIVGTILVGIQYYIAQEKHTYTGAMTKFWTKGWLVFFLFITFTVYFTNVYMIVRGQLGPWYRWWQSAKEIKLILENRKTHHPYRRLRKTEAQPQASGGPATGAVTVNMQDAYRNPPITEEEVAIGTVFLNVRTNDSGEADNRRHTVLPIPGESDDAPMREVNTQQPPQQAESQPEQFPLEHRDRKQDTVPCIDV